MLRFLLNTSKSKLRNIVQVLNGNGNGEFYRRMKRRHRTFWEAPDAETIRNAPMDASDPMEKWRTSENWQRKLSNKYNSREFAKKHGCQVPQLYWKGRETEEIPFDRLPQQYVIRPTVGHSANLVFLMDHSVNLMDKRSYTREEITETLGKALAQNPYLEFLIEEFVRSEKGEYTIPDDYKVYTFGGEVACIQVINRLGRKEGLTSFYSESWDLLENMNTLYPETTYQQPPECLQEIIARAKELGRSYGIFVRIDFYATDKGAVFGEFTPTPGMGKGFSPYADRLFIGYWDRLCKGTV
ncbi:ATP-grasp fold amidoligase family protein [Pontibacter locisalis]|uniref:ATP-grasp fold amidoligase family protein n=1 Tax=Pontibacter locisalis TaxID=1719035 RepID=A0ABW5IJI9_9BACT